MSNLELKPSGYYALLIVPADVREVLGRRKYSKSLGTSVRREAEKRAAPYLTLWKTTIDQARGKHNAVVAEGLKWKAIFEDLEAQGVPEVFSDFLPEQYEKIEAKHGAANADLFIQVVQEKVTLIEIPFEQWKAKLNPSNKGHNQKAKDVALLTQRFPALEQINRKDVTAWIRDLTQDGKTWISLNRILINCRDFWKFVTYHDLVPEQVNPFTEVLPTTKAQSLKASEDSKEARTSFTTDQVVSIWETAGTSVKKQDKQLQDLIALAAYTGARINELCMLKVADVTEDTITIISSKTKAGIRQVPIHSALIPLVNRLKSSSTDGYLGSVLNHI